MTSERIYEGRFKKAVLHFKGVPALETKETAGAALNSAVRQAAVDGVNVILKGMAEDLNSLINMGGDGVQEQIGEVFSLASAATRKLLRVADIKAGKAHWAMKAHFETDIVDLKDAPKPETKSWISETLSEITPGS